MAWSKVYKPKEKPLGWWFHKILCEYGWLVRRYDYEKTYYYNLGALCKYGFNLYGQKI